MNTLKSELEAMEVEFLHGVPVKLPKATITAILTAVEAIGERVIGEYEPLDTAISYLGDMFEFR